MFDFLFKKKEEKVEYRPEATQTLINLLELNISDYRLGKIDREKFLENEKTLVQLSEMVARKRIDRLEAVISEKSHA